MAKVVLESKIKQLDEVSESIRRSEGAEAVQNVLDEKLVRRCLVKCLGYLSENESGMDDDDYYIYSGYAEQALKEAEAIIDNELAKLEL